MSATKIQKFRLRESAIRARRRAAWETTSGSSSSRPTRSSRRRGPPALARAARGRLPPTPLLAGYVQNRPSRRNGERLGSRSICSETWFADHDAEKASFASDYHATVMPDERRFLARESAWMGRFLDEPPWPDPLPRYRVLAFGAELAGGATATVDRQPPTVASLWLDDRDEALSARAAVDGHAFAAEPAVLIPPPPA